MAIFYLKVHRINPHNPKDDRKRHPAIKNIGKIDGHDVSKDDIEPQEGKWQSIRYKSVEKTIKSMRPKKESRLGTPLIR